MVLKGMMADVVARQQTDLQAGTCSNCEGRGNKAFLSAVDVTLQEALLT
jgi:hypothetical protein